MPTPRPSPGLMSWLGCCLPVIVRLQLAKLSALDVAVLVRTVGEATQAHGHCSSLLALTEISSSPG